MSKLLISFIIFVGLASSCGQQEAQETQQSEVKKFAPLGRVVKKIANHVPDFKQAGDWFKHPVRKLDELGRASYLGLINEARLAGLLGKQEEAHEMLVQAKKLKKELNRFWRLYSLEPENPVYIMQHAFELQKLLNQNTVWLKQHKEMVDTMAVLGSLKTTNPGLEKVLRARIVALSKKLFLGNDDPHMLMEVYAPLWKAKRDQILNLRAGRELLKQFDALTVQNEVLLKELYKQIADLKLQIPGYQDLKPKAFLNVLRKTDPLTGLMLEFSTIEKVLMAYHNTLSTLKHLPANTRKVMKSTLGSIGNYIQTVTKSGFKVPQRVTELYAEVKTNLLLRNSVKK